MESASGYELLDEGSIPSTYTNKNLIDEYCILLCMERCVSMVETSGLLNRQTLIGSRGFESHSLRQ